MVRRLSRSGLRLKSDSPEIFRMHDAPSLTTSSSFCDETTPAKQWTTASDFRHSCPQPTATEMLVACAAPSGTTAVSAIGQTTLPGCRTMTPRDCPKSSRLPIGTFQRVVLSQRGLWKASNGACLQVVGRSTGQIASLGRRRPALNKRSRQPVGAAASGHAVCFGAHADR